jgi:hypothetical protein
MKELSVMYAIIAIIAFIAAIAEFYSYNGTGFVACGIAGILSGFFHIICEKLA